LIATLSILILLDGRSPALEKIKALKIYEKFYSDFVRTIEIMGLTIVISLISLWFTNKILLLIEILLLSISIVWLHHCVWLLKRIIQEVHSKSREQSKGS